MDLMFKDPMLITEPINVNRNVLRKHLTSKPEQKHAAMPPLPFNLSAVLIDDNKEGGISLI